MSKSIKIKDSLYDRLVEIMDKRETFSDVLTRVLRVYDTVSSVRDTLGPHHYLMGGRDSFGREVKTPK